MIKSYYIRKIVDNQLGQVKQNPHTQTAVADWKQSADSLFSL